MSTSSDSPATPDRMLTYREVSALTGIEVATLYTMVSRKRIPHYRLGGRMVRFRESEVRAWMEQGHVNVR